MAEIYIADASFDRSILAGASCAAGVFDGVHCGHAYLINQAIHTAQAAGCRSVALTFDKDPDELFRPDSLKKLLSNEARLEMLAQSGVDCVVTLPFTPEFAAEGPTDFLRLTFGGNVPAALHVGDNFRFGAKAAGIVEDLVIWGRQSGCTIHAHRLLSADGSTISATRIRGLLGEGKVEEANELLGYEYRLQGTVVAGRGEGTSMGFATANLHVDEMLQVLGDGVYSGKVVIDGKPYRAAIAVGASPLFVDTEPPYAEVHILDFEGDLYERPIQVEFVGFIRPMMEFPDVDVLIATVKDNINYVRETVML